MKTTRKIAWAVAASGIAVLALTAGCVYEGPPPPPGVAVVGFVPDYCFWDGFEYVGWYDDDYYYWGPSHVWIACDPIRVQRVHVWIHDHPDWRGHAFPTVQSQYRVQANEPPHQQQPPQLQHPPHPPHPQHPQPPLHAQNSRDRDHNRDWHRDHDHDHG